MAVALPACEGALAKRACDGVVVVSMPFLFSLCLFEKLLPSLTLIQWRISTVLLGFGTDKTVGQWR